MFLKDIYNNRIKFYEKKDRALTEINNYIETTINRCYYTIIRDLLTPYEKLKALKENLKPTPLQLKHAARSAY
jgi:hypothetical protein